VRDARDMLSVRLRHDAASVCVREWVGGWVGVYMGVFICLCVHGASVMVHLRHDAALVRV